MTEDTKYAHKDAEAFALHGELRMEWEAAINTVEEVLEFYYTHASDVPTDTDYDRNDVETVANAWQRIRQG